jgi:Tfp pilus assembly protein PilF
MSNKLQFAFLIFISLLFSLYSCNSDVKKSALKVDNDSIVLNNAFPADSFAFYENILMKDSLNIPLHMDLAVNYYAENKLDKAIVHLLKVCSIDTKNLDAFITLGNVYFDAEQSENAVIYYEKALVLDPTNINVKCDLATSYLNIRNTEKSLQLLRENIKIAPNHAQSHHNLSIVYSQMGKIKEAEAEMKIFNELNK